MGQLMMKFVDFIIINTFFIRKFIMILNLQNDRRRQRNITPNFLRFKRKSTTPNGSSTERKESEQKGTQTQQNTERSASRASRSSFEVYQKRVLHLSKLRSNLKHEKQKQQVVQQPSLKRTNYVTGDLLKNRVQATSHQKKLERQNSQNQNAQLTKLSQTRRKTPSSGNNLLRLANRTPSNQKGTQSSLEKQEQNAKRINAEFINTMMKNQLKPNYINKVQQKKVQNQKKKPSNTQKQSILNLNIPIKGQQELKKYEIFGELGKGAYGLVRMGLDKRSGQKIAIKIYEKKRLDEQNKIKNLEREINLLAELDHPTIAKLIEAIQTQTQIYLILEYGGANSLYNYLLSKPQHRMQEAEAKQFLLVIAETLQYLHKLDIVHRDIKAENILLNRHKQLKLIDFGFSLRCGKGEKIDTFCGTPTYMAPEIVSKIDHVPVYTDMWSLGILYYVMLQGNYPFRAKNENDLFQKIKKGQFEYIHNQITERSKRFIQSLLQVQPLKRLTINDVLSKENRQWLAGQPQPQLKIQSL